MCVCVCVCVCVTLEWRQCLNSVSASVLKRVCADYECFITATSAFSCELSTKAHWQILFLLAFFTSSLSSLSLSLSLPSLSLSLPSLFLPSLCLSLSSPSPLSLLDGRLAPFSTLTFSLRSFPSSLSPLSLWWISRQQGIIVLGAEALVFLLVWKAWQVRLLCSLLSLFRTKSARNKSRFTRSTRLALSRAFFTRSISTKTSRDSGDKFGKMSRRRRLYFTLISAAWNYPLNE